MPPYPILRHFTSPCVSLCPLPLLVAQCRVDTLKCRVVRSLRCGGRTPTGLHVCHIARPDEAEVQSDVSLKQLQACPPEHAQSQVGNLDHLNVTAVHGRDCVQPRKVPIWWVCLVANARQAWSVPTGHSRFAQAAGGSSSRGRADS